MKIGQLLEKIWNRIIVACRLLEKREQNRSLQIIKPYKRMSAGQFNAFWGMEINFIRTDTKGDKNLTKENVHN